MRTNEKRLRMCFFQAPLASGFVRVVWDADSAGVVERAEVEQSTIDDSHVEQCLIGSNRVAAGMRHLGT